MIGIVLLALTGMLCWLAWSRSNFRRSTGFVELLRLILVVCVVVTLCQPEWLSTQRSDQRPAIAVLWDESDSMITKDVIDHENIGGEPMSRAEAIQSLQSESMWAPAIESELAEADSMDVVFEPFSSRLDPPQQGTDIHWGLSQVLENHSNLRGVVVLSDGDWNAGSSPAQAATQYRMKGIPIYTVGIGSEVALPDLEMVSMDAPTFGVVQKPLRIPFRVRSTLGQDRDLSITLSVDNQPAMTRVVRVPAMGQAQQHLSWTPPSTGDFTLTMSLPKIDQDLIAENNTISAPISVRQEQLKVLVIESYPRWEYRYLRNALERDPGVELTCLLYHPELTQSGGGRGYIKQFPNANELTPFDVVFLGDVGINPDQLSFEQAQDLKQLVSAQAAGLVFLPGRYGFQETLTAGPLADLYPVVVDKGRPTGKGSVDPGHFSLTQAGQRSLLTRLADGDDANADVWGRLPGFNWYAGIERAKLGTEVLAVHNREATPSGRVPLIVTKPYGTGKVLLMGTDGAWRWREGVEDRYHYRFWGQVARWMAYQRQKAAGKSMRLFSSPDRPRIDDRVTLNANVLNELGGFLEEGTVVVQAISPGGRTQTIRLQAGVDDARGLFAGSFTPSESGVYRLVASSSETGASIQTDLSVQGLNREQRGRLARFDVLEEISSISGGRFVPFANVQGLLDELARLPEPDPAVHRTRVWAHPVWGVFIILLMGAFWTGRKLIGEV